MRLPYLLTVCAVTPETDHSLLIEPTAVTCMLTDMATVSSGQNRLQQSERNCADHRSVQQ